MTEPTPIRPVGSDWDIAQEMAEFLAGRAREYQKEYGIPPHSVALVLMGNPADCDQYSEVNVWCPSNPKLSRTAASATASALLLKHSLNL